MEGIPAVKQFVGVPTTAPPTIYTGWLFAQFIPHFYVLEHQLQFQFPSLLEFYSDWVPNPTLILTPTWMQWLLSHSHIPHVSPMCAHAYLQSVVRVFSFLPHHADIPIYAIALIVVVPVILIATVTILMAICYWYYRKNQRVVIKVL